MVAVPIQGTAIFTAFTHLQLVRRYGTDMATDTPQLDTLQQTYKSAVDAWVNAIRHEEQLASVNHSEAQIDEWELAADAEKDARTKAKDAKKAYEAALREEFFKF